jgi:hypothetical protein
MMMFPIPAALLFFALGASAAPKAEPMQVSVQQIARRDVWVPPIEEPTSQTTWYTGTQATVTWYVWTWGAHKASWWREPDHLACICRDASDPPQQISNPKGTILLGFLLANGTGGENLDVGQSLPAGAYIFRRLMIYVMLVFVSEHPLAQGFDLIDGEVSFGVPSNIEPGTNYIIARECLPFLSQYDGVYSPPQSSATLGISAHNLLLHLRQIEKKIRYSTIYTSHNTF